MVDSPSCFSMWYRGLDWTIGLEVQELIDRLRSFVEGFNEMGADLVFFVGGLTPFKKRKSWLIRRIKSLNQMMNVHDMLYAGKTFEEIAVKLNLNSIPPNMGNFVAFVLKHVLDCTVSFNFQVHDYCMMSTAICCAVAYQSRISDLKVLNDYECLKAQIMNIRIFLIMTYMGLSYLLFVGF